MKSIYSIIATLALACVFPAAATAAVGDPEIIIYRVSGINVGGFSQQFSCTPLSGVAESIRFVTRNNAGAVVDNQAVTINHLNTATFVPTGAVTAGTAAVAATSNFVVCSVVMTGGASGLHLIRFNPMTGTQE